MSVVVVASFQPLPEHRDEVIAVLEETIAKVHREDEGCELYSLNEGDDRLVMIEKWASPEALAAHGKNPTLAELGPRLAGKMGGAPEMMVLRPHPAGTPEQGAL